MATVNALKCKHPKNEAKMHFIYLQQSSAHSNSTSKDFTKLLAQVHHQAPIGMFQGFYLQVIEVLHSKLLY